MTPQQQIAYLRALHAERLFNMHTGPAIIAVCDLAERALAYDEAAREVRLRWDERNEQGTIAARLFERACVDLFAVIGEMP
jgi:hypothetical protein